MTTRKVLSLLAVLMAVALFAAACGSDDDDGDSASDDAADEEAADEEAADDEAADDEAADDEAADDGDDGDDVELTQDGGTLAAVQERGSVVCGLNDTLPGFGVVDEAGDTTGFDVDFCRAVAAGVLGDSEAFEVVHLTPEARFTALQSGEIDVLIRNTTWTATRDGAEGVRFLKTTYFDGQGMMVAASSGFTELTDLADASICVLSGTTTELNLTAVFDARGIPFNPVVFESNETLNPAYVEGQCEAWTSDASQLTSFKATLEAEGIEEQTIMAEVFSKEPLGPAVSDGDEEWAQIIDWITIATIQGWEFAALTDGECCDSTTVGSYAGDDPNVLNFIGDGGFDPGLNLSPTFAVDVIEQVGNYQEIYEAHLPALGLQLEGSPNDLWLNGGLMYVPPYR